MAGRSIDPGTPNADAQGRVRDVKPYAIVDDLEQLRGPAGGVVEGEWINGQLLYSNGGFPKGRLPV